MAPSTPIRKSRRQPVPSKKYTVDAFEGLDLLGSENERDKEPLQGTPTEVINDDTDGHDEFSEGDAAVSEPVAGEDDEMSAAGGSDGSGVATPVDSDGEASIISTAEPVRSRRKQVQSVVHEEDTHTRGMTESRIKASRTNDLLFLEQVVGSDSRDLRYFRQTRERWVGVTSLPTKQPNSYGQEGMDYLFNHTAEQREQEATVGWDWYFDGGGKTTFQATQTLEEFTVDVGAKYITRPTKSSHGILMGPYGKQQLIIVPFMQSIGIDESWSLAHLNHSANFGNHDQGAPDKRQDGWLLNLGINVRCLEWAPNHPGNTQYLALSTLPLTISGSEQPPRSAPAYTASPSTKSCIQIWAFTRVAGSGDIVSQDPHLRMVICTELGHAKHLRWCPMPKNARTAEAKAEIHLGLLAGIWSDGYVRVLDLYLDNNPESDTQYVKCKSAVFQARPPSTLCTCVTWLSPTDIAVGCANGYLALWNIFPATTANHQKRSAASSSVPIPSRDYLPSASATSPRPYVYIPIHHSYVLAISSAYPPYPHFLCTSSISGHLRLTDIRSPASDFVFAPHTRFGPSSIVYSAHISCFLTTHEDGKFIHAWPLRRFWAYIGLAKGDSELLSLSTSAYHPTILGGFADGTLLAFNPLKRFVGGRIREGQPQQKVWRHEWSNLKQEARGSSSLREGISRMTEGYKTDITALDVKQNKPVKGHRRPFVSDDVAPTFTIYEEESGIRVVSWNPNPGWGGWAASGMGSGLVRIEDLAV